MSVIMLVLGIVTIATGVVTVGLGIPNNEFGLGNTLIIAGTSAIAGGLVVVGLAGVILQLTRLSAMLKAHPLSKPVEPLEPATSSIARSGASKLPFPLKSRGDASGRKRQVAEPSYSESADSPEHASLDRSRLGFAAPSRNGGEPPLVEDAEDVPLSPRPPRWPPAAPLSAEAEADREARPPRPSSPRPLRPTFRPESGRIPSGRPVSEDALRPRPAGGADTTNGFDAAWSDDTRPQRQSAGDAGGHGQGYELGRDVPGAAPRARGHAETSRRDEPPLRSSELAPVTILKSGVVDGMAYTLYTDGSIEAELAQGVVRFGSIEELRNHLEKSS